MLISNQQYIAPGTSTIEVESVGDNLFSIHLIDKSDSCNRLHVVFNKEEAHKLFWQLNHELMHDEEYRGDNE
jgi:multisubunit Na+/H+ antiporter MnhE subunit